jgi:anti-sigma factor RsiW
VPPPWRWPGTICTSCLRWCLGEWREQRLNQRLLGTRALLQGSAAAVLPSEATLRACCAVIRRTELAAAACRQDLPAEQAGWPSQLFGACTAIFGLASFALVLALIEQVGAGAWPQGGHALGLRLTGTGVGGKGRG